MTLKRHRIIIVVTFCSLVICLSTLNVHTGLWYKGSSKPPIILVWSSSRGNEDFESGVYNYQLPEECGSCTVTNDRRYQADCAAIEIYNNQASLKADDFPDPTLRKPSQLYVFHTRETPAKTYAGRGRYVFNDSRIDGMFNMTWYSRRDADVVMRISSYEYVLYQSNQDESLSNLTRLLESKTKYAVWLVSNCYHTYGATKRMEYAKEMMTAGFKLDGFGACFNNEIPGGKVSRGPLLRKYKFYLSFENSIACPDYITEKFWKNSLELGAVPIVFGPTKADVEAVAPPNSFIHTEDFKSPSDLVKYLNYLNENDEAYLKYHEWRKRKLDHVPKFYDVTRKKREICQLCYKIPEYQRKGKTIPSVDDWMYKSPRYTSDECLMNAKEQKDYYGEMKRVSKIHRNAKF